MSATFILHEVKYNLGSIEHIPPGEGRRYEVEGLSLAVFRTRENRVFATQAVCPHREGPLADGIIGAGKVICPLHGYKFNLATGEPVGHPCAALKTYPVVVTSDGHMILTLERV
ncbi:MAG TPA: Rieske (2Fe-2S) protein [Ktedonobacteraceae bacterium]|jgi:nitrite reductase (NADH) small subunit|nr:Rieske (2Fe-2S) protein [Ktedonobacteraceae bacterium]